MAKLNGTSHMKTIIVENHMHYGPLFEWVRECVNLFMCIASSVQVELFDYFVRNNTKMKEERTKWNIKKKQKEKKIRQTKTSQIFICFGNDIATISEYIRLCCLCKRVRCAQLIILFIRMWINKMNFIH